jgi:hypothetical protein
MCSSVQAALGRDGGGSYSGMRGAELRECLQEVVLKMNQCVRGQKAVLLNREASLLAQRAGLALSGECCVSCTVPPSHAVKGTE